MTSLSAIPVQTGFAYYLQTGGGTLATGYTVGHGDGTETKLWLDSAGIGVKSAGGYVSKIASLATAIRSTSLADADGTLFPAITAKLAADFPTTSTTAVDVTSFSLALATSSVYEFEAMLLVKSSLSTVSPRFALLGPSAQTSWIYYEAVGANVTAGQATAFGTAWNNAANTPGNDVPFYIALRGACKTSASIPATLVSLQLWAEAAGTVTLLAGSTLKFRKVN
jgi:hypothetical protein